MLEKGAENIKNAENPSSENLRAYSAILDWTEREGYDITEYRKIVREAYIKLEQEADNSSS